MKKIFAVLLVFVLIISLSACGNDANLNTDSTKNTSISSESSNVSSDTSSVNELSIPNGLIGLIDENEKPYGEGKVFYQDKINRIKLTCSDNEGLVGKFEYYKNGEKGYTFDWEYAGDGIYIQDHVKPYKYFMHKGYLVKMDLSSLIDNKLNGNYENGYCYKSADGTGWIFYENGTVEYKPNASFSTSEGTYEMISDTIMKVITTYDGETTIGFYLIDNENYMYQAYPQVWND